MKINIPVNHNFYEESSLDEDKLCEMFNVNQKQINKIKNLFSSVFELKLGDERLKQIKILNFKSKPFKSDKECLILKLYSKEENNNQKYVVQTGLYAGIIYYKGCQFNITTNYSDIFLQRMLNFIHDIFIDTEKNNAQKENSNNQFLFIIAHIFIQTLEKSEILGLPQEYKIQQERNHKIRGKIDLNRYLKYDIPFQGKISTLVRNKVYVQEIIDILFLTLKQLEKNFGTKINTRLLNIKQLLKEQYSGKYVTFGTLQKAKKHPVLNNPLYTNFRRILEYAEIILLDRGLVIDNKKNKLEITGYLFDISELFELYLEKLLVKNFPDWSVNGQVKIPIYQAQFYGRSIYPDLVMTHKKTKQVVVFDAKFKKMSMNVRDIDIEDIHQIHSYSGYYQDNLITSGLIYPLSKNINKDNIEKHHCLGLYGKKSNSYFIIDGIYIDDELQKMEELINKEYEFIERLKSKISQA